MIITQILFTLFVWIVLGLLSTNLLGFFVRGLFPNPGFEKLKLEADEFIKKQIEKSERANAIVNVTAFLLIIAYLYATFRFGNFGVMMVAILLMSARLPDLLREIKTGQKITRELLKTKPQGGIDYVSTFLYWFTLPFLYFSLYYFK